MSKGEKQRFWDNTKGYDLTSIQKIIGKRMSLSKRTKPCFYLQARADATELKSIRPKLRKSLGVKITTNVFYIKALALAASEFPMMAGRLNGQNIILSNTVNVGFAVNAPHGLVVPVVKHADTKNIIEIATEEKLLTEKARDNKLTLQDMEEENVALSNLGAYDIDSFIGIVPPPASTILSVGNIIASVVCKDGKPTVRRLLNLTLAVDHRIANGDYAAGFLAFIKNKIEHPMELVE